MPLSIPSYQREVGGGETCLVWHNDAVAIFIHRIHSTLASRPRKPGIRVRMLLPSLAAVALPARIANHAVVRDEMQSRGRREAASVFVLSY